MQAEIRILVNNDTLGTYELDADIAPALQAFVEYWCRIKLNEEVDVTRSGILFFNGTLDLLYSTQREISNDLDLWIICDARGGGYMANYEFYDYNKLLYTFLQTRNVESNTFSITHELLHAILLKQGKPIRIAVGRVHDNEKQVIVEKFNIGGREWLALGGNYD